MSAFSTEGTMEMGRCTTTFAACAYGFTGKERDTESGNDYFLARYYNSTTGRFLSPDWSASVDPVPCANLGDPQTLNLYSYAYNNPLLLVDLYGHAGCSLEGMPQDSAACSFLAGMRDRIQTVAGNAETMIKSGWGEMFGAFGSFISASKNMVRVRVVGHIIPDSAQVVQPNPAVTVDADAMGVLGSLLRNTPLQVASSVISVVNDPSPENIGMTGGTTLACYAFPVLDVPVAYGTAVYAGSTFVADQVIIPVFTPDASQADTIDDGYGHTITAPNAVDWNQAFVVQ